MPCAPHDADHAELLRAAHLRVTAARIAILDALCHAPSALDAQEVADRVRAANGRHKTFKTDRVTVYRTLTALADAGIAHRVEAGDRVWRYALAGRGDHDAHAPPRTPHTHQQPPTPAKPLPAYLDHSHSHPHFVCDSCGRVECLDELAVVLKPARPGANAAKVRRDRRITSQQVLLHGTCDQCAKSAR